MSNELRVIISGGGTGGHIFPAVSIANAIKQMQPDAKILFVGALGRMEMQRVPAAGYEIKGLPIQGFDRKHLLKNIKVLYKIWKSQRMARKIIRDFRPQVAVGVGGYAERFFPADKIMLTGNPVRQQLLDTTISKADALRTFGLNPSKKTVLIVGGSLGARTLNESVLTHLEQIRHSGVQFIWQTGKYYYGNIMERLGKEKAKPDNLVVTDFISDMGAAYKAADVVVSRAGAGSISEFCLLGKPVILVPSPNVAEDHQTKNALALVNRQAALYVKDVEAPQLLLPLAIDTVNDDAKLQSLHENILKMALPSSAEMIAKEVLKLASNGN